MTTQSSWNESKQLFDENLKGKNIMTPDVIRYGVAGRYAYELSSGTGLTREPIYGVTIVLRGSGERRHDLSKMCESLEEAESYISSLRDIQTGYGEDQHER